MKYAFLSIILLLLVGCGASPIVPYTQNEGGDFSIINYPSSEASVEKRIGEAIIKKGKLEIRDALTITKQTQFNKAEDDVSFWTCALTVDPQTLFLRGKYETKKIKAECYGSVNTRRTLADGTTNFNCPGAPLIAADICKKSDGEVFLAFLSQMAELEQDFDNLEFGKQTSTSKENFVQEIVYNGRDGDKVKFVYKEYSGVTEKPDYFQEFHSDISESADVVFKNIKFKVLKATGTAITYQLHEAL